jgi:flavin-dependent dehydrogenase
VDVFIIGGGPAGLATAIAARKKGFEVTVADGAEPPIDKACGEGLMPGALEALEELGVSLHASEGRAFCGIRFLDGKTVAEASFPVGNAIGIRRTILHERLVEHAEACGGSFLWKTPVTGIFPDGVEAGGIKFPAKWIVGADGSASRVRKWAGIAAHQREERRFAFRQHYRVKPWTDFMEVHWGHEMQAYVTPLGAEEICVALIACKPGIRMVAIEKEFPFLAEKLRGAELLSTERGAVTGLHRVKRVYRNNVALVGDASGNIDAITGEGLCLGFQQAVALAKAFEAENLERYQRAHSHLAKRPRMLEKLLLLLDRRPVLRRHVLRVLSADPKMFARLLAFHTGATSERYYLRMGALFGWKMLEAWSREGAR